MREAGAEGGRKDGESEEQRKDGMKGEGKNGGNGRGSQWERRMKRVKTVKGKMVEGRMEGKEMGSNG